jgi:hypothetical protein
MHAWKTEKSSAGPHCVSLLKAVCLLVSNACENLSIRKNNSVAGEAFGVSGAVHGAL